MTAFTESATFGLALTLVAWGLAQRLARGRSRWSVLLNPVLVGAGIVIAVLAVGKIDYTHYLHGAAPLADLLGPAVVALALPIHRHRRLIGTMLPALVLASSTSALAGITVAVGVGAVAGASNGTLLALSTAHTTSPVAFAVVSGLGGFGSLAVVFAIASGILGAVAAPSVLRLFRVRDQRVVGYALGSVTHAIGTSRALELGALPGALAGVGMAVSSVVISCLVPAMMYIPAVRQIMGM